MNRPKMTSKLYRALLEMSALRDEVRALAGEMTQETESRYLSRLDLLEAAAVRLADQCERRGGTRSH
jgi:hypothetical protein